VAQKVLVALVDDVDGSEADESVKFALDGVAYEIDLSSKNAQKLRGVLEPYVEVARRTGGRASRGRGRPPTLAAAGGSSGGRKAETAEIRAWAKAQGYDVSDRGRIPADIIDAFHKKR
jgi:nucleoid-associated protein Lsr2